MRLNRAELRKVMYDFNSIANRLLKAEFRDYKEVLKKFLLFISTSPIIVEYLNDCGSPTIPNIEAELDAVAKSYGSLIFTTGDTAAEENANIFAILRKLAESNMPIVQVVQSYSNSNKYNDIIKSFNERFVLIMIRNIEGYLTKLGIDMGLDETVQYNITVNNGQVNLASDNSIIHATVNNGVNQAELQVLLNRVIAESKSILPEDDDTTVSESIEILQQELKQAKLKKSVLCGILTTLQGIKGSAEFLAAVTALVQFIQPFIR